MLAVSPGKTIYYFSFWVLMCGLSLLFFSDLMLAIILPTAENAIIARIFGMVLLFLAFYYYRAGAKEDYYDFYNWTVYTRMSTILFTAFFVFFNFIGPILFAFILVDVLGALWTWSALKRAGKWQ